LATRASATVGKTSQSSSGDPGVLGTRMAALILKRASASRPSGEWNDDDFDVLTDGVVVGRIY
jgi:hypothetical protein